MWRVALLWLGSHMWNLSGTPSSSVSNCSTPFCFLISGYAPLLRIMLDATVEIAIWSTTEAGLAITAGSLACTRPLIKAAKMKIGTLHCLGPGGQYQRNTDNKSNEQSPFPKTIGSASPRRVDVLAMDSLADYPDNKHIDGDEEILEAWPMRDHPHASTGGFAWGERRSGATVDARAREMKTGSWYNDN